MESILRSYACSSKRLSPLRPGGLLLHELEYTALSADTIHSLLEAHYLPPMGIAGSLSQLGTFPDWVLSALSYVQLPALPAPAREFVGTSCSWIFYAGASAADFALPRLRASAPNEFDAVFSALDRPRDDKSARIAVFAALYSVLYPGSTFLIGTTQPVHAVDVWSLWESAVPRIERSPELLCTVLRKLQGLEMLNEIDP